MKFDWFEYIIRDYCESVKFPCFDQWKSTDVTAKNFFLLMNQWKLTDLRVKNICSTDESVGTQIGDSISENLTDSDLES